MVQQLCSTDLTYHIYLKVMGRSSLNMVYLISSFKSCSVSDDISKIQKLVF